MKELTDILRLGSKWDDEEVSESDRSRFLKRRWILETTTNQPGKISSVMTISLDYTSGHSTEVHRDFEERVLPALISKNEITSLYRGRPQNLSMHYVLRITSDIDLLFALIDEVHEIASNARVLVTTTTYVVVKKMSNLSLEKAILLPTIPIDEANYRNNHILSRLSEEDRVRAIYLPQGEQRLYIERFRTVEGAISNLGDRQWLQGRLKNALNDLAKGLLHEDFAELKEAHDLLQNKVERLLVELIEKEVTDSDLDAWRGSINIQPGKKKNLLTYVERIRLAAKTIEERKLNDDKLADVRSLTSTREIRNALAHGDWEERKAEGKISIVSYVDALIIYCAFISKWEK